MKEFLLYRDRVRCKIPSDSLHILSVSVVVSVSGTVNEPLQLHRIKTPKAVLWPNQYCNLTKSHARLSNSPLSVA